MAMGTGIGTSQAERRQAVAGADAGYVDAPALKIFVFALFFMFGGITSLNDVIIPKLKALYTLSYHEAMLVQSAYFAAYFVISLPGAALVRRVGYMRAAAFGLLLMTVGCLLFIPASSSGLFATFLGALFVLAAGVTIVQVVTNPLISLLGPPATTHSRLTFAQAFNSIGTTIFPPIGSMLILGSLNKVDASKLQGAALTAYRAAETHVVVITYIGLAIALAIIAALVWGYRKRLPPTPFEAVTMRHMWHLLHEPRFGFGALCIFLYVGAEVSIGSLMVNYLELPTVLSLDPVSAGQRLIFYWGGAMVGRIIGSAVLRAFSPGKVLAFHAAFAIALIAISANSGGLTSGATLLGVGLFNSIMFPTIFALACEGLGPRAAEASGIICVAIVGGAVVPWITGQVADWAHADLKFALLVPAICYAGIFAFGVYARRPAEARASAGTAVTQTGAAG